MTRSLQSQLETHIEHDESLLWLGKPKTGIVFRTSDIFLVPFSLIWCGFVVFWCASVADISPLMSLFGVPFVLVGLFMVFGRFILDARQRANTVYGITEHRIIIKSGIFSKSIKSIRAC